VTISGGTAPYIVTGGSILVASASISGSVLTVTALGPGACVLQVIDAAGLWTTLQLNVDNIVAGGGSLIQSQLQPLSATAATLPLGKTILLVGYVPGLTNAAYYVPYVVGSLTTAATSFGSGTRLTRAIGEILLQGADAILAVAVDANYSSIFTYLSDLPFDILCLVGFGLDTGTVYNDFTSFAYARENRGLPITIVGSVAEQLAANLIGNPLSINSIISSAGGSPINYGRYVVALPDQVVVNPNTPTAYTTDAAPCFAGLLGSTDPWISATNQFLQGVTLPNPYSAAQITTLSSLGYTMLRNTVRGGVVVNAAVTTTSSTASAAAYQPTFHTHSTYRSIQYVESYLHSALQSTIGESNVSGISQAVTTILDELKRAGAILAYDVNVQIAQVAGAVTITLAILPLYETQMVTVYTRINLQAA
jgi:hypothetical protein